MDNVAFIMSISAGDRAEWVNQAIESMFDQQGVDCEKIHVYLCVDGPVGQDVSDCVARWSERVHRTFINETACGLTFSLNRMIRALEDESFVFRMDADDVCHPCRVEGQLAFMKANPEILVCGGAIREFSESPDLCGFVRSYPADTQAMRKYIVKASPFAHPTVCFRRSFFKKVGLYNEKFPMRQDIELWFRAVEQNLPMANLSDPVLWFRVSEDLLSRRNAKVGRLEFRLFFAGIYRLYGIHPALFFPLIRLLVRMLPVSLTRLIYHGNSRDLLNPSDGRLG